MRQNITYLQANTRVVIFTILTLVQSFALREIFKILLRYVQKMPVKVLKWLKN